MLSRIDHKIQSNTCRNPLLMGDGFGSGQGLQKENKCVILLQNAENGLEDDFQRQFVIVRVRTSAYECFIRTTGVIRPAHIILYKTDEFIF